MKQIIKKHHWVIFVLLIIGAFYLGKANGDLNKTLIYGKTGAPRNCRAIITEGIQGWSGGAYTAESTLDFINKNCGAEGYSWGLK